MDGTKNYSIADIEALTEAEAVAMALEKLDIKGYNVYLVDFAGYFGYSCLVFKNGYHIHYANDYELHHRSKSRDELRTWYIMQMNHILFTDEEISAPLADYDELRRKEDYLRNYYGMQADHLSIFGTFRTEQDKIEHELKRLGFPYCNHVAFAWYADKDFVNRHMALYEKLMKARDAMKDNFEFQKNAFKYEMGNHEYHINWQADYDTLSAFGNICYHGDEPDELEQYFNELHFTKVQREAYLAARREYLRAAEY